MCQDDAHASFRLAGKVVEILQDGDRRRVKVALEPWAVVELGPHDVSDLHLGERLRLEAELTHAARAGGGLSHEHPHGHVHDEGGHDARVHHPIVARPAGARPAGSHRPQGRRRS